MKQAAIALLALTGPAACAALPPGPVVIDAAAVERGRMLAQRACSGCHAVGADDASVRGAPAFRELGPRQEILVIDRTLARAAAGHSMPPRWLTSDERRDVAAYIAALD